MIQRTEFGAKLRNARRSADLTLREVAKSVGITTGYLSEMESGRKHPPNTLLIARISKALSITDGSLIDAAAKGREQMPSHFSEMIRQRPLLYKLMVKAVDLSDEALERLLTRLPVK